MSGTPLSIDDTLKPHHQAVTLGRQALDMVKTDAESMSIRLVAILLFHPGDIEKKTGVSAEYMRHYDESGRMLQGLLEQSPFDTTVKKNIAVVLERKGTEPSLPRRAGLQGIVKNTLKSLRNFSRFI